MKHLSFVLCLFTGMISSPTFSSNNISPHTSEKQNRVPKIRASHFSCHPHENRSLEKPKRPDSPRIDPANIDWMDFLKKQAEQI